MEQLSESIFLSVNINSVALNYIVGCYLIILIYFFFAIYVHLIFNQWFLMKKRFPFFASFFFKHSLRSTYRREKKLDSKRTG